jgi:hypothetical protein
MSGIDRIDLIGGDANYLSANAFDAFSSKLFILSIRVIQ